jgi:hypothetical protein
MRVQALAELKGTATEAVATLKHQAAGLGARTIRLEVGGMR